MTDYGRPVNILDKYQAAELYPKNNILFWKLDRHNVMSATRILKDDRYTGVVTALRLRAGVMISCVYVFVFSCGKKNHASNIVTSLRHQ